MALSPIEEIKTRLDIVDVIQSYIKLQKTGANYRALCPFHSEKKPSFFVSPSRQIWHCFGCSVGGDIFRFVMAIENVEFGDALKILAKKAGVTLKKEDPRLRTERQRLYEICELATRFFEKQLEVSSIGKKAQEYLQGRGINQQSMKRWRLGYAPDTWQGLLDFLVSNNFKAEEIERAGLIIRSEVSSSFYDRFRGRIMFPVFDLNSQVVGFGGRIFEHPQVKNRGQDLKGAKYLNTPNTLIYDKSRILYGLDKARMEIRKKNFAILVEGYVDVIMSNQLGIGNIVATSGTALTPYHLKMLKRYSENILTAFDMDIAGDFATKRGIDLAQTQGFNIKVIMMPEDFDPADLILKDPEKWKELIDSSRSILDFYFDSTLSRLDPKTPQGKKDISKILLPVIKRIPNKIEQSFWVQRLAKALEVNENAVMEELQKIKSESQYFLEKKDTLPIEEKKNRKELLEEKMIILILKSPEKLLVNIGEQESDFLSPDIVKLIKSLKERKSKTDFSGCLPESIDLLNYLTLKSEFEEISDKDLEKEFNICLIELKILEIKNKLGEISEAIREAEAKQDINKVQTLTEEFRNLSRSLQGL